MLTILVVDRSHAAVAYILMLVSGADAHQEDAYVWPAWRGRRLGALSKAGNLRSLAAGRPHRLARRDFAGSTKASTSGPGRPGTRARRALTVALSDVWPIAIRDPNVLTGSGAIAPDLGVLVDLVARLLYPSGTQLPEDCPCLVPR